MTAISYIPTYRSLEEAKTAAEKELDKTKKEKDALREDLRVVHVSYSISLHVDKSVFTFMHIHICTGCVPCKLYAWLMPDH